MIEFFAKIPPMTRMFKNSLSQEWSSFLENLLKSDSYHMSEEYGGVIPRYFDEIRVIGERWIARGYVTVDEITNILQLHKRERKDRLGMISMMYDFCRAEYFIDILKQIRHGKEQDVLPPAQYYAMIDARFQDADGLSED